MKSTKLFAMPLASVLVAMALSSGATSAFSQAATAAATAAPTAAGTAAASAKYCTGDIAFANQAKHYYIPVISKGFAFQFWQVVRQGAYDAARDCGVAIDYVGPADETKVDDQINMLQAELARNPSAIVFAALDTKAATPLLQQAQTAKIPVVAFDSGVANDIPVATAATDNVAAAAVAADHMASLIGNAGDIAVIVHGTASQTAIDRKNGFVNEIKAKYPNVNIVDIQYAEGGDQTKADDEAKAIITAHPNLKGIFATNEGVIQGTLQAMTELSIPAGKLVVIGYDSGKPQIDAINNGFEAGAITQSPYGIGYKAVEAAVKVLNGVSVSKTIDTGFFWYDKKNIADPNIALLLYQ